MGPLTNTKILHEVLNESGLRFTPPAPNLSSSAGPDVTTLSFGDSDGGSWLLYVFSHREAALLRFYSQIAPADGIPPQRVLELINHINYSYLVESGLDYVTNAQIVRYKAAFRGVGVGLPAYEALGAVQSHISRSAYLHHLLKRAYHSTRPSADLALDELYPIVSAKLGL